VRPSTLVRAVTCGPRRRRLRLATVVDDGLAAGLRPECELLPLRSDRWEEELSAAEPDLLLVEAAWGATAGSWQYQVASYDHHEHASPDNLASLVEASRARGIPTAFWNRAEPESAGRFRAAATLFDQVFSCVAEDAGAHRRDRGGGFQGVRPLPPAVQPRLHNPIGAGRRSEAPGFAGAIDADWPEARRSAAEGVLEGAARLGLVTYEDRSRRDGLPRPPADRLSLGPPAGDAGPDAYRRHVVFVDAGSAPESDTAVSPRALELAACGTAVVSPPSAALEHALDGLAVIADGPDAAQGAIEALVAGADARERRAREARRLVLAEHTYANRLLPIAEAAGLEIHAEDARPAVAVLVDSLADAGRLGSLCARLADQSLAPAEVLVGTAIDEPLDAELEPLRGRPVRFPRSADGVDRTGSPGTAAPRVTVLAQDGRASAPERHRELACLSGAAWVAILRPTVRCDRHHLRDLVDESLSADADVVGAPIGDAPARAFSDGVDPEAVLARRDAIARIGWSFERPDGLSPPPWMTEAARAGTRFLTAGRGPEAGVRAAP
jgi:hypothetical protein